MRRSAFYIDAGERRLFALLSEPTAAAHGVVIHVPAFAEEMNKSRQMVGLATQRFVADNWAVLQFDLSGCGDSYGLFDDASWDAWLEDLDAVVQWCRNRFPDFDHVVLWGLRAGALLAGNWAGRRSVSLPMLLWHPVLNGKLHLTQFLRLRAANEMLSDADSRNAMADLRAQLDAGQPIYIAGYAVSPELARGMNQAAFVLPPNFHCKLATFEVGAASEEAVPAELSPASRNAVEKWRSQGAEVTAELIPGQAFWSTQYLRTVPELIEASSRALAWMAE